MQISLRLAGHGWSDLDLWLGEKHLSFCITHIFNSPLADIADAILSLSRGSTEASFTLHDEPGRCDWTITQIPDSPHLLLVEIRSYRENFGSSKPAHDVTEFRVARSFFLGSFVLEFQKLSFQLQHSDFAKDRDAAEFPWDTLRELQDIELKRIDLGTDGNLHSPDRPRVTEG